ncbi:MAG: DUF3108 domain-containing protein [Bacteroidia bacterium]|jgi:hypothetical protein|nr:DUF3108 domain-containing protein [Bacteroidia bacterium]
MASMKFFQLKFLVPVLLLVPLLSFVLPHYALIETEALLTSHVEEPLPLKNNIAFKAGEVLTYRMHYGLLDAGEAVLEVKPDLKTFGDRKVYHIVGNGYTTGTTDWFFKVRDRYETYLDKDALLPWYFVRRVDEGGFKFSQDYVFDHFSNKVNVGNNQKMDVPPGVQDMVSAFYAARNLDLGKAKEGDVFSLTCFMDKELWPLKIKFIRREVIKTDLGKVHSLLFRPLVQKGRVFKQDEDLSVWISDDNNHIPLRVEAKILIGSVKMDLSACKNLANPLRRAN